MMEGLFPKDGDHIKVLIGILSVVAAIISLAAAWIGRRKEVVNRQEIIHRDSSSQITPADSDIQANVKTAARKCPRCGSREFSKFRGVRGCGHGFVTAFLCLFAVVPGVIYFLLVQRTILRCRDCGELIFPAEARRAARSMPTVDSGNRTRTAIGIIFLAVAIVLAVFVWWNRTQQERRDRERHDTRNTMLVQHVVDGLT